MVSPDARPAETAVRSGVRVEALAKRLTNCRRNFDLG